MDSFLLINFEIVVRHTYFVPDYCGATHMFLSLISYVEFHIMKYEAKSGMDSYVEYHIENYGFRDKGGAC